MNKLFSTLFAVVFATSMLAQSGLTCEDPIPVDSNYVGTVPAAGAYWYTAGTYDLPLKVHFKPYNTSSSLSPEVIVDFTCIPGYYADQKLDSVINGVSSFGVELPIEFMCDRVLVDGNIEYDLYIDRKYREQLAECGITYNVQALVKVNFFDAGEISLRPDTAFISCINNSEYVNLGDTIDILPNDSTRAFVFPYSEWKKDSVRFVWIGENSASVWLASDDCEFVPSLTSVSVWDNFQVSSTNVYKMYPDQIKDAINNHNGGGLFYGKVVSGSQGKLVVEKIPMAAAQGGAILMEYGKAVKVAANDSNALYCFPRTWKATQFVANTNYVVSMYASNVPDFNISDKNLLGVYFYSLEGRERVQELSDLDMYVLTDNVLDDFIYVRFKCSEDMVVTPYQWSASYCEGNSKLIIPNKPFDVLKSSKNDIYRLRYADWVDYDITIDWYGNGKVPVYIADTCSFALTSSNSRIVLKPVPTISRNGSYTISSTTIEGWMSRVDANGYLYVRFDPSSNGELTFLTDKPEEKDPEPLSHCVSISSEIKLGDILNINLASVHTIYRINYAEWQAAGATLAWEGTSPLHTFLAGTCTFPVAPHNRYVLDYEAVLPAGEKVMAADWLARMAQYVDEDGYLYIRFLTEFEGTLRVK